MKVYKWLLCIVLVAAICFCFIRFGNFESDDPSQQGPAVTAPVSETAQPVTEFTFSEEEFSAKLLTVINAYRERFSLTPWTIDQQLNDSAKVRATECSILGTKSHVRPDGKQWYTVLGIEQNYNYSEIAGKSSQSSEELLRSWVSSEAINNGLLSAEYTSCGIGCAAMGGDVYTILILYKP
ncbi:MAG: CAP domain-containing protein [Clostridia bacterium]|nr:CAP domain-containing protein [Clostridia bacterium]